MLLLVIRTVQNIGINNNLLSPAAQVEVARQPRNLFSGELCAINAWHPTCASSIFFTVTRVDGSLACPLSPNRLR
jgi:hypothetical protein